MVQEIVHNILVYVILTTILRELISEPSFQGIFRFVCGLILILLCVEPVLSGLSFEQDWYKKLEENILEVDSRVADREIHAADGTFQELLQTECEKRMEMEMLETLQKEDEGVEKVSVKIREQEDDSYGVEKVTVWIRGKEATKKENAGKDSSEKDNAGAIKVQEIIIAEKTEEKSQEDQSGVDKSTVRRLRKRLIDTYELSSEVIHICKITD